MNWPRSGMPLATRTEFPRVAKARQWQVLLLGSTGQLGQEILRRVRQELALPFTLSVLNREQFDLATLNQKLDSHPLAAQLALFDIIINCAAYTAVDLAESEAELATAINHHAVEYLAQFAADHDQILIHISTDFVFDGQIGRPYLETDSPAPLNHYGRSKLGGELAIEASLERFVILRTAWLFSEFGHSFVKSIGQKLLAGQSLRIVGDQFGCPTPAAEVAKVVIGFCQRIVAGEEVYGLWHFVGAPATTWYQLAVAIAESLAERGHPTSPEQITAITSDQWPAAARRPNYSVLDCGKICARFAIELPNWKLFL
ncbi:MAG: dTDP-4-dehydrorhamnose reductase [Candidatus Pacebacteria bacterium]|nr:dTDP-4-dehydrorhamnose reductase [Candidatus Paceibacterota bacterium]